MICYSYGASNLERFIIHGGYRSLGINVTYSQLLFWIQTLLNPLLSLYFVVCSPCALAFAAFRWKKLFTNTSPNCCPGPWSGQRLDGGQTRAFTMRNFHQRVCVANFKAKPWPMDGGHLKHDFKQFNLQSMMGNLIQQVINKGTIDGFEHCSCGAF